MPPPPRTLPAAAGIGLKAQHVTGLLEAPGPVRWLEVHAENYMGAGGRPLAQLRALAERFPISVHGVGLSDRPASVRSRDTSRGCATSERLAEQPASLFPKHLANGRRH